MPVSGQLCGTAGGGPAMASRFPVAFRRVGVRFGVILCPLGDGRSLRSAYQAQLGLDPNGVATFDTDQIRPGRVLPLPREDRKSTRLNSSHVKISYAVFCLKKKKK